LLLPRARRPVGAELAEAPGRPRLARCRAPPAPRAAATFGGIPSPSGGAGRDKVLPLRAGRRRRDVDPALSPRLVHQLAHPPHARLEADEDRLADEEMADVELAHLRDRGDRRDIIVGEAVAGVDLAAVLGRQPRGLG